MDVAQLLKGNSMHIHCANYMLIDAYKSTERMHSDNLGMLSFMW